MSTPDALRLAEACDLACIASCECVTASPDPAWHDTHCKYRTLREAAAELRRQHAEIDRLEQYSAHCEEVIAAHNAVGARQEAEIERLRADAARYQWLTHDDERIGERMRGMLDQWDGCDGKTGFDLAIDAAMRDAPGADLSGRTRSA